MTPATEQARLAFSEGVAQFERADFEAASRSFEAALAFAPGRPSVMLNLGVTRAYLGQFAAAEPLLEQVLALDDSQPDAWAALGWAQMETAQWHEALRSLERAVALGADAPVQHLRLGQCLAQQGRLAQALAAFSRAVAQDPSLAEGWSQHGHTLREMNRWPEAAESYQRALALGADPELHSYYLAAIGQARPVDSPPQAYVETLFDQYAHDFEHHLVDQLGYQAHRLLIEHLPRACPARFDRVLDLGCGTGLCGPLIRSRAGFLTGVDLSAPMIEKADALQVYDELVQADLLTFLAAQASMSCGLVLAADVFIYVGRLEQVWAQLARVVPRGGWLAFTAEESDTGEDLRLLPTLRYAHSAAYFDALAAEHGFTRRALLRAPLRLNQAQSLVGCYGYFQKT